MGATEEEDGGVNVLPIPPPLEFPYPTHSGKVSEASVASSGQQARGTDNLDHNGSPPEPSLDPATSGLLEQVGGPDKRPTGPRRRIMTEGPPKKNRSTPFQIRRLQTGAPPDVLNFAAWDSTSDSSSSSDEGASGKTQTKGKTGNATSASPARGKSGRRQSDDRYRKFSIGNEDYSTKGRVSKRDGRLNISVNETANKGYLAKTLEVTLRHHLKGSSTDEGQTLSPLREEDLSERPAFKHVGTTSTLKSLAQMNYDVGTIPKLCIVIMVIGSRGDIQPFLRLGKILKEEHGHRVRIATHPVFKEFVEKDSQLEFFSVGGDPAELMAFMVKNPGLIPKAKTIREGEIGRRREAMYEMFKGFWRACINATDDERDIENLKMMGDKNPFVADAIIANPPSFAHIHCAERLGIPLHLMFTFPTSPTQQFPHPLTNIKQSNLDANYTNFMSYPLVEMMTWQGLGDLINRFRVKSLGLEPLSTLWAPGQIFRQRVPHSYLWSPGLIPKPADWGPEIAVTGFVFLDLASSFKPAEDLNTFLKAGEPPVYIGFGSIVVDDPDRFTKLIFDAVKMAGVRALVSKGWGGLGSEEDVPENVFMLGNTPHDWLFPQVSAVVHHGGAGSTAIGLKCGRPTMIVPFFGDQPFWGAMVAKAGAGAEPVPYKHLTAELLADSIKQLLTPEAKSAAQALAQGIADEGDGAINAVESFHQSLPLRGNHSMRCSILEDEVAVWWLKDTHVRLSALAAEILVKKRKIRWGQLRLVRHYDWNDFEGPGEPLTGAGASMIRSTGRVMKGVGSTPWRWAASVKRKEKQKKRMEGRKSQEKGRNRNKGAAEESPEVEEAAGGSPDAVPSRSALVNDHNGSSKAASMPTNNFMESTLNTGPMLEDLGDAENDVIGDKSNTPGAMEGLLQQLKSHASEDVSKGDEPIAQSLVRGAGVGLAKSGRAILTAPMDLSLSLAQGFHNAPRLYGDETVRTPIRVTGMRSGLRAARKEASYGVYDGWTGLVKHPYNGAKKGGAVGFAQGVGKGVGGFVLKDFAALFAIPAYTLKGIEKELHKGRQPTNFIRRAHIIQGQKALAALSQEDLLKTVETVIKGWRTIDYVQSERKAAEQSGIRGRIFVYRSRKKWKEHGVFENVEQIGRAVEAERQGRDFNKEFARHRAELKAAQSPRMSTAAASHHRDSGDAQRGRVDQKVQRGGLGGAGGGSSAANEKEAAQPEGGRKSSELAGLKSGTNAVDQAALAEKKSAAAAAAMNGRRSKEITRGANGAAITGSGPPVSNGLLKPSLSI